MVLWSSFRVSQALLPPLSRQPHKSSEDLQDACLHLARKSPRAWKSIGVGAGFDVQVLHTTSLLSGFCSEAERSHLGPSRGYFQLLALSLQGP